jgi:hypothetical protein
MGKLIASVALFAFMNMTTCRISSTEGEPPVVSTRPSTQPVSIGVCDKEDIDDGTIVAMSFISLKGRTDLYPMFSTATVIGSTPVHRALVLLSRDDEELVAIGIVREDKRDDRRVFLVALQTRLPVAFDAPGWRVLDVRLNGEGYVIGTTIEPGEYRIELTIARQNE